MALLAAASAGGSWCAAVGLPDLGAVALADLGIDLGRFALVPSPGPAWAEATATLFDGIDAVLLCPPFPPRPAMARRLVSDGVPKELASSLREAGVEMIVVD